jgi:transglutaminase-like putative cysteine protease
MIAATLLALVLFSLAGTSTAAPPEWVRQAATISAGGSAATVVLDDVRVTYDANGRVRTTRRFAVRINDRAARDMAVLRELYLTESGKVREMRAWIVRTAGETRDLGNRDVLDIALVNNDVYNEVRARVIDASDDVRDGDLFAGESESEARLPFPQLEWTLQERWPVKSARRSLTVPDGWSAAAVTFNAPAVEPHREGAAFVWTMSDLPGWPDETAMPPLSDLAPRLAVSILPPADVSSTARFDSWPSVARWLDALTAAAAKPTDTVTTKARELTTGVSSEFQRIAAIGRFVQRIQYVSIQTGIGRGGGYQPRPAGLVLERNYGDCKDKANLMRAMLSTVGIQSHLVTIFSGDRNYVREGWPSPQQFNHAIIAVTLTSATDAPAVVSHPSLGRLLLFDPTDEHTPVGELPLHEQGSLALVVAAKDGDLLRVPVAPANHHRIERTISGRIDPTGTLSATVVEQFGGTYAARERALATRLESVSYTDTLGRRASAAVPRAIISDVQRSGESPVAFELKYQVTAAGFGQHQGPLMLVTPPLESPIGLGAAASRKTAIHLEPRSLVEKVRLEIPDGLRVDELPAPVTLETTFGRYSVRCTTEKNVIVIDRTLEMPLQTVRPDQYSEARAFFDRVKASDRSPIVLSRR